LIDRLLPCHRPPDVLYCSQYALRLLANSLVTLCSLVGGECLACTLILKPKAGRCYALTLSTCPGRRHERAHPIAVPGTRPGRV
jgi:hypothetical protein